MYVPSILANICSLQNTTAEKVYEMYFLLSNGQYHLVCKYYVYHSTVVIGFEQTAFTVDEDAGTVELFVRVLEGSIPSGETRTVTVSTSDRTAGKTL